MYLGTQDQPRDDTDLEVLAQLGVNHICASPPEPWLQWDVDLLMRYRERLEGRGVSLDMIPLPLGSRAALENDAPHVFLGPSSERDREIDQICELMRNASLAGINAVKYNITILGHMRTSPRYGRGGAKLSSFRYPELDQSVPDAEGSPAPAEVVWERIDHFLERVVPVAEEYKVRMACHPQDPGIGDRMYRGVARVLGTVEGLKNFVGMRESPYHGLNFCQGTVSEMLEKPGDEIYDVIRYFGGRNKIFNVHFRNIKGGLLDFVEVFPDEGHVDMLEALRTYKEVGYQYMIMPDHVPQISGAEAHRTAFAYCYGYIHALLRAVNGTEVCQTDLV
jgi:mannonate dehydratase